MDAQALYRTLEGTFNSNGDIRHEAERQLKQAETMPGYLGVIFQVAAAPEVQENVRLAAALRLKNSLKAMDWNADKSPVLPDEKQLVKKAMVSAVMAAPSRVRNVLLEGLRFILEYDFPQAWPSLVDEVVHHLQGQDVERIVGALSILRVVAKRFEFKQDADVRAPLDEMVVKCFPLLVQLFQYVNALPTPPPEAGLIQKLLCKVYWSSTNMQIPPMFFANPPHLAQWLDCFLQVLVQPVPVTDHLNPKWKVKKWIGHIVNRLLTRYGNPRGNKKQEQQLGEAFVENYAGKFLEAWMFVCGWYRAKQYVSPQPLALALNYIDSAMDFKQTCEVVNAHLDVLLFEIIFPLLCFSEADAELWQDNPQEYIRKLYDPMGDLYNPRLSATNLLMRLSAPTKPFHVKDCLHRFLAFVNQHLSKYQVDAQKDYRAKDGCLFALGSLRRRLRTSDEYKAVLEPLLITHVLPEFQSPHGFLRAKACWVCGQFSKIEWQSGEALAGIVRHILVLMNDAELPVRVQAGTSLKDFVKIKKTQEVVQPMLEQMVGSLFKLMNEIDNDCVIETLEYIIEKFGDNLANAALSLCRMLCEHFIKTNPNLDGDDDRELQEEEEEQALAAAACLRALCTLIAAVHEHEELYPQMEHFFVPLLRMLLTKNKSEYLDETLELISRLTYFQKKISPELWQVVFPLIYEAYNDWAPDYFDQMLAPLDNFISRDPATFCRGGQNNVRFIQMAYNMMEKCLSNEDLESEFATCPKLMDSILQNCRDYQLEANEFVPRMFDLIMRTMQQKPDMGDGFKILCLNVIACGMFYNAQLTVQYLTERQIVTPVFNMWIGAIPNFGRHYDKKLSLVGLSALLQAVNAHGTGWLPATYFNAEQLRTIAGIVMKLVLECHEEQKRLDEESEDSDEESDDSSDDDDDLDDDDDEIDDEEAHPKGDGAFKFVEDGGQSLDKLIKEAREVKFGDKFNFTDDDDLEDEDYECIIMDLEEAIIVRDVIGEMATKQPELYSSVMGALTPEAKANLEAAVKYAETKRVEKAAAEAKKAAK
eukprot:EG_transcript_1036